MKRLFYELFTSKEKKFTNTIAVVERDGVILEIDTMNQWFAAVAHYNLYEIHESDGASAPNLILIRRKDLRQVAHMKLVVDMKKSEILLGDFESKIEDQGYGSILLRNLIKLAEMLNVKTITGNLSSVDSNHFDKLRHIYEKFGFEVNIENKEGTIKRRI